MHDFSSILQLVTKTSIDVYRKNVSIVHKDEVVAEQTASVRFVILILNLHSVFKNFKVAKLDFGD